MEPIYYTKVEFRESLGFSEYASGSILLLNLVNKELSYQKYKQKQSGVPIIMGEKTEEFNGKQFIYPFFKNAAIMKNNKIGFDGKLIIFVLPELRILTCQGLIFQWIIMMKIIFGQLKNYIGI